MDTVKLSPRFQVTIPRRVRRQIVLLPGAKLTVVCLDGRIELIPCRPATQLRGFLRGKDVAFEREDDDRV